MTTRRGDDPEHFDATPFRRDEPTLRIGYREASLSVRGVSVFLALGILLIVGSNFYSGWLIQVTIAKETGRIADTLSALIAKQTAEHVALAGAQDRTSCILTMTPEDRAKFRGRYQTGAFRQECPWVSD